MLDDDFSFLTGKQADLDNDGKVSFGEYMNDCDDFNRIMLNKNHSTGRYKPQQQQTEGKGQLPDTHSPPEESSRLSALLCYTEEQTWKNDGNISLPPFSDRRSFSDHYRWNLQTVQKEMRRPVPGEDP